MSHNGEQMAKKYLMVITHSDDDQDRANGAIGMTVSQKPLKESNDTGA